MDLRVDELKHLASLGPELAVREAPAILAALSINLPSDSHPSGISTLHSDADVNLQLFVWPPGMWTPIHDHTSWGVYLCLEGMLLEDRFVRLDEGARPSTAHLRRDWRELWRAGQCSTVLPNAGGIHRVGNPSDRRSASLHLYGPRIGAMDGRDYDPTRDFVCDRPVSSGERVLLAA
jgi:predicted metal-dependent enzyme (double-stranded beta helix superfamily)